MSRRMSSRILVIALIVLLIAVAIVDQRWWWATGSNISVVTAIHMYVGYLWPLAILLHVFWLNRIGHRLL